MEKTTKIVLGAVMFIAIILLALVARNGESLVNTGSNLVNTGSSGSGQGSIFVNSGNNGASQEKKIIIVDEIPDEKHWFNLEDVRIEGKELVVDVSYSACENHVFNAYSTAGQGFMESAPVQTNVYFVHENLEEVCDDAIISQTYRFDLQPLIDEYKSAYGSEDKIILNVYGYGMIFEESVYYLP